MLGEFLVAATFCMTAWQATSHRLLHELHRLDNIILFLVLVIND